MSADVPTKLGWLINFSTTEIQEKIEEDDTDNEGNSGKKSFSAVDCFFLDENGDSFKAGLKYSPYFFISVEDNKETEVEDRVAKKFSCTAEIVEKNDLGQLNHLSGIKRKFIKLSFDKISQLTHTRNLIQQMIATNQKKTRKDDAVEKQLLSEFEGSSLVLGENENEKIVNHLDYINGIFEYDIKYYVRVAIDLNLRAGCWYEVSDTEPATIKLRPDLLKRATPKTLAFDIETTKQPLRFPDAKKDEIMMISYMIDGEGFLIVNREIVSEDIENFDYNPTPEYSGPFTCYNEKNEEALLKKWFDHIQEVKPHVYATFNGDFFDWPFIEQRAAVHGMSMKEKTGFFKHTEGEGENVYRSDKCEVHLDCFAWVQRDSYLPHGSQGLKAVTRKKLGYTPDELDPEEMLPMAKSKPKILASYSVSDAVATFYLYKKYIEPFIFSLCTIIPLPPEETLRKGSGTLCESLLMVEAQKCNIIFPNRYQADPEKTFNGHLISSETYIGGHVESLKSGIYRSDQIQSFELNPTIIDDLTSQMDDILQFALCSVRKQKKEDIVDYDEIKEGLIKQLEELKNNPIRKEKPKIYHLDVAAMYPNIILTNRLTPSSIVDDMVCSNCIFNSKENNCQRKMEWHQRVEHFTADTKDYSMVKRQLQKEMFPNPYYDTQMKEFEMRRDGVDIHNYPRRNNNNKNFNNGNNNNKNFNNNNNKNFNNSNNNFSNNNKNFSNNNKSFNSNKKFGNNNNNNKSSSSDHQDNDKPPSPKIPFSELPKEKQMIIVKTRLGQISQKVYGKKFSKEAEVKEAVVCQRENPFYVDTVRRFRDRRYEFKDKLKEWQQKANPNNDEDKSQEIDKMVVLYDSLQLAHKCILNSFYGYVMRKAARWFSMEMAGIVTYCGANIITMTRKIVDGIGFSLELDTDGIWCCLPVSFPEKVTFTTSKGKKITINFACEMLNCMVNKIYKNDQYQDLTDPETLKYDTHTECSIFFEVDGPYHAMVLPASKEEGKGIKKRYAVFNFQGDISELKGFEIKRRGELKIIKEFQSKIFKTFMMGKTLEETYKEVGTMADRYLDILFSRGEGLEDNDLFYFITESSNMSKTMKEYGIQKSARLTTARRLAEIIGDDVLDNKGLVCNYIVAKKPESAKVSERAIPILIFQKDEDFILEKLRKWMKEPSLTTVDIREIVDWDYYIERLSGTIQKIVTIPAALQGIENPCPRIQHPDWLKKKIVMAKETAKQMKITSMFASVKKQQEEHPQEIRDIEEVLGKEKEIMANSAKKATKKSSKSKEKDAKRKREEDDKESEKADERQKKKRKLNKLQFQYENPFQPLDSTFFDDKVFPEWLETQKKKWKRYRNIKNGTASSKTKSNDFEQNDEDFDMEDQYSSGTVGGYLQRQQMLVKKKNWQIVQIVESHEKSDTLDVFFVIDDTTAVRKISLDLSQDEEIKEQSQKNNLDKVFQAVSQLGAVCKLKTAKQSKSLNELSIADVSAVTPSETNYLNDRQTKIHKIFLYSSFDENAKKGVFGIFFFQTKKAHIFTIQQMNALFQPQKLDFSRISQKAATDFQESSKNNKANAIFEENLDPETKKLLKACNFNLDVSYLSYDSKDEVSSNIDTLLNEYQTNYKNPTVFISQTPFVFKELKQQFKQLENFPVVTYPFTTILNEKPIDSIAIESEDEEDKILESQSSKMFNSLYQVIPKFQKMLEISTKFNVPIGNIEQQPDEELFLIDLLFFRQISTEFSKDSENLTKSLKSAADVIAKNKNRDQSQFFFEPKLEISRPSVYHNTVFEFNLINLSISAILDDIPTPSYAQGVIPTFSHETEKLFSLFQRMVREWKKTNLKINKGKQEPGNFFASEEIRKNIFRYLRNRTTRLYFPALNHLVFEKMKLLLVRLLAYSQKVGGQIVFANFNKLMISTPFKGLKTNEEYKEIAQNIIKLIQKNPIFAKIEIVQSKIYQKLIFIDPKNHVGLYEETKAIISSNSDILEIDSSTLQTSDVEIIEKTEKTEKFDANLDICSSIFPKEVENLFISLISDYLTQINSVRKQILAEKSSNSIKTSYGNVINATLEMIQEKEKAKAAKCMKDVEKAVEINLFTIKEAENQQKKQNNSSNFKKKLKDLYLQQYSSSDSQTTASLSLEFMKTLHFIFNLDPLLNEESSGLLKKNLLSLIGVSEFSKSTKFIKPNISYPLRNVICSNCFMSSDFDLCRDAKLTDFEHPNSGWKCPNCGKEYDMKLIEIQLLTEMQSMITRYHAQGFNFLDSNPKGKENENKRTKQKEEEGMNEAKGADLKFKLKILKVIAEFHGFDWLLGSVSSILNPNYHKK